jgi:NADH:ubiquinone oxidoreductase subunit 3 (subunit A)
MCSIIGDNEFNISNFDIWFLGFIVFNIINIFSFRDLLKRFGLLKIARRDYYECGFRPQTQRVIRLPIQFVLICCFFLLYDIELVFMVPYISAVTFLGLFDLFLYVYFLFFFFISIIFDYERHALFWQNS